MKKWFLILISLLFFNINVVRAETVNLAEGAKSAYMIEVNSGEVIFSKNIHEKLSPASMTKIMTMLLIMENLDNGNLSLDEKVRASSHASSMGGSQIFLEAGEEMTVRDLLKGIAVASGNDASVAMAERIGGTEENFVSMMNERAKSLGLKNTNFRNASGLDQENHYSTAHDMGVMALELLKHPEILKYTSIYEGYLRENTDRSFWLVNTNKLVRFYQGVDGLKTGYTDTAGYCLTATATKNNLRFLTVVMGYEDGAKRNAEVSAMLDYGFNTYDVESILNVNSKIGTITINNGKTIVNDIVPSENVSILYKKTSNKRAITMDISLFDVNAPIEKGDVVGKLDLIENNKVFKSIDITVLEDVKKANLFEVYFRYLKDILLGNFK